ncbi:hypothetical protein EVAR_69097_1 [Eumeta japonica]|uniref:Nucleic-acid-binding protein from transposon X-element n=1 Tax=Eumeta variegata TaxID=151549 RepID=A0A4C1ZIY6_EUMVA|nr:hypothetical protein EVAR_69097_1 [Eumeta japonica]
MKADQEPSHGCRYKTNRPQVKPRWRTRLRPSYERRAAARKAPSEILDAISDPARRRIPNPVLRRTQRHPRSSAKTSASRTDWVGREDIEIETDADTSSESSRRTGKDDDDHDATIRTTTTVTKRSRDALSSLSPIQESAPKRADQRASIDAETPRSPSPEQYAELTLNSTTYAALAVEAGEGRERYLSLPPSLTPIKTYAAMAASPPRPKSQLQDNERRISPGSSTAVTGKKAGTTTTVQSDVAADADAITQGVRGYPPLVVESLPNWVSHFEELRRLLGHTPNARPFGKGVRFLPKSDTEFRTVQRYLQAAARKDNHITWFCYAPVTEKPTKVGIRGLPVDTAPDAIITALQQLGFPAEYARPIPPRKGRPGCLFYVRLGHTNQDGLQRLYGVNTLLNMPGVTIEGWRSNGSPTMPSLPDVRAFISELPPAAAMRTLRRRSPGGRLPEAPGSKTHVRKLPRPPPGKRQEMSGLSKGSSSKRDHDPPPPYQPNRTPLPYIGGVVGGRKRKRFAD